MNSSGGSGLIQKSHIEGIDSNTVSWYSTRKIGKSCPVTQQAAQYDSLCSWCGVEVSTNWSRFLAERYVLTYARAVGNSSRKNHRATNRVIGFQDSAPFTIGLSTLTWLLGPSKQPIYFTSLKPQPLISCCSEDFGSTSIKLSLPRILMPWSHLERQKSTRQCLWMPFRARWSPFLKGWLIWWVG